jgi:glycosyltransferase involved in cell wall biosynthesis
MNQEYALMGGLLWKLWGKRVYLWRNHYKGSAFTRLAAAFCTKVFYTSRFSYTARFKNGVQMPVGVDVDSAHMDVAVERVPHSILFLARLDESKHPDLFIKALGILAQQQVPFTATIAGGPSDPRSEYPEHLRAQAQKEGIAAQVRFAGAVPNTETFRYYRAHEIFVNCSRSGMLDKTMFKAVACGCLVATASRDFAAMVSDPRFIFAEGDALALAERLKHLLALPPADKTSAVEQLEKKVLHEQSLPVLVSRLVREMEPRPR